MRLLPISHFYPSLTHRYDYMVFIHDTPATDSRRYNVSTSVHIPIQVHPAAVISLSPDALDILSNPVR